MSSGKAGSSIDASLPARKERRACSAAGAALKDGVTKAGAAASDLKAAVFRLRYSASQEPPWMRHVVAERKKILYTV